jgi:hypothetical protein
VSHFVRHAKEFSQRLDYMHMNPVRKGLVKRAEDWPWSSYNNFGLDTEKIKHAKSAEAGASPGPTFKRQYARRARCRIQIDYVRLPDGYRG